MRQAIILRDANMRFAQSLLPPLTAIRKRHAGTRIISDRNFFLQRPRQLHIGGLNNNASTKIITDKNNTTTAPRRNPKNDASGFRYTARVFETNNNYSYRIRRGFSSTNYAQYSDSADSQRQHRIRRSMMYCVGGCIIVYGCCWLTVPLYRMYCQSTGQGQATSKGHKDYSFLEAEKFVTNDTRLVKVTFQATVHPSLGWQFEPQQNHMIIAPGETALAFYRAKNKTDRPIIGASVYSILPGDAGIYFNKIQCFCFDEQLINPNEEVDLPILFYIDPEFGLDSRMNHINEISLSYVFFESDSEIPEEFQELQELKEFHKEKVKLRHHVPIAGAPLPTNTAASV